MISVLWHVTKRRKKEQKAKLTAFPDLVLFLAAFMLSSFASDPSAPKVKIARYKRPIKTRVLTRNFIFLSSDLFYYFFFAKGEHELPPDRLMTNSQVILEQVLSLDNVRVSKSITFLNLNYWSLFAETAIWRLQIATRVAKKKDWFADATSKHENQSFYDLWNNIYLSQKCMYKPTSFELYYNHVIPFKLKEMVGIWIRSLFLF